MNDQTPERRVRLISQGYNTWRVQVLFSDTELSASEISDRLREVKADLAAHFGVPDTLLEYKQLLSKKVTRLGLLVQMQIVRQQVPSGAPRFRAMPLQMEDGALFSDMRIEATFFPLDEFDRPLTRQGVEAHLKSEGFDSECIQWDTVEGALQKLEETFTPVADIEIGRATPPGIGQSSRLTYGVPIHHEPMLPSAWAGVRPVVKGEFLVEVSSATSGHKWGRNVYGRELEPQQGVATRLVAGNGSRLVLRDTQLMASQDGMLIFDRAPRDKRSRDTYDLIPIKLTAHVLPVTTINTTEALDVELSEPAAIFGRIEPGSRIRSNYPLYIEGDVAEGAAIRCTNTVRITGAVLKAEVSAGKHMCIGGDVYGSTLRAGLTLQIDGCATDSQLTATDVIVAKTSGGQVDAIRQADLTHIEDIGGRASAIRINLRRYLQHRQTAGHEVLIELRESLRQILSVFGPEITFQVTEGSAQRLLLKWLREQKSAGAPNYTRVEMEEFRAVLEMIPLIKEQVKAIGMELRDITAQLVDESSDKDQSPTATSV